MSLSRAVFALRVFGTWRTFGVERLRQRASVRDAAVPECLGSAARDVPQDDVRHGIGPVSSREEFLKSWVGALLQRT